MQLHLHDTFNKELPADAIKDNEVRQVANACFSFVKPVIPTKPSIIHVSQDALQLIGLTKNSISDSQFVDVFSGAAIYPHTQPFAMCYGGHQFGHWAGQLGDGRAINLFEVKHNNQQWAVQLKGAGKTPYSRRADGLAVLRSSIREYLCSEAMHHLGVPTTRALSLMLSGDDVLRDVMYDGNAQYEKGAIVCRVAPSFIRFGNFQIMAAQQNEPLLKQLTDYTIIHFFPEINLNTGKEAYVQFFATVAKRTLALMIEWKRVGFVHGVMNTDNLSVLGLTIDYGPYGWLEDYDPDWTPNTTDSEHKRYRFGNQANIGLWNLVQLDNALYPLINDEKPLEAILNNYKTDYAQQHTHMQVAKLGLIQASVDNMQVIASLENLLQESEIDMTLFYRNIAQFDGLNIMSTWLLIIKSSYSTHIDDYKQRWETWLANYAAAIIAENNKDRVVTMNKVNPKYVLRNYMAQLAIEKADAGDYSLIEELAELLKKPYDEQPENAHWFAKRPDWATHKVGCSQLSCSS